VITQRSASVTYMKADQRDGRPPAIRIRLRAGERITPAEWSDVERAIRTVDGVVQVVHSPSDTYTYIAVQMATTPARHTDAGVIADCRAVCQAANITIVAGPSEMPQH
jgi:hypothetical protein